MFSLIISIIAIALVAALAAASVYYGGSAFNKGTAGADASTFVNNGQQINGAFTLSATDGNSYTAVADLVTGDYLSQAPTYKGEDFVISDTKSEYVVLGNATTPVAVTAQVCEEIVNRGGQDVVIGSATELFGCDYSDGTGSMVPFYKVK